MLTAVDVCQVYARCSAEFGVQVHALDGRWDAPTPRPGWAVRHIVEEEGRAPPLFAGETITEVGDRFAGDLLGDDPASAFDDGAALALPAGFAGGATDAEVFGTVREWFGPMQATRREIGVIGPRVEIPAGAGARAELWRMLGRTP